MTLPCLRDGLPAALPFSVTQLPHRVKLDQNEAPVDLPEPLKREMCEELAARPWNRYPQPSEYVAAKRRFAAALELDPDGLCVTAGGDQTIMAAFHLAGGPGRRARWWEPTYPYIPLASSVTHTHAEPLVMDGRFEEGMVAAALLRDPAPHLVALVSPNNPTGGMVPSAVIEDALAGETRLVFLDEAYADFAGETRIAQAGPRPNLLIGRSMSKALVAGVRLGYCVGHPTVIRALECALAGPYHLNQLQLIVAARIAEVLPCLRAAVREVVGERERVHRRLAEMPGVSPRPSRANFLLFRIDGAPDRAKAAHAALAARGVRVRDVGGLPGLAGWLRVTVGTGAENDLFLTALREALDRAAS